MKKTTNDIEKISNAIIKNASAEISQVLDVLDLEFEDLYFLIRDLSDNEKDEIISIVINKLLEELKSNITMEKYRKIARDVDEITDYYTSKKKEDFDAVIEEGDQIANELLFKVIGRNDQQFDLPIDIASVKKYCLSSEIKKEQVYDVLLWIVIRYVAIDRCLNWQEYLKDYEADKEENL